MSSVPCEYVCFVVLGENFRVKLGSFWLDTHAWLTSWRNLATDALSILLWGWRNGTRHIWLHTPYHIGTMSRVLFTGCLYIDNAPVLSCGVPSIVYIIMMMLYTRSLNVKKYHNTKVRTRCGNHRHFYLHTYIFFLCCGTNGTDFVRTL